MKFDCDSKKEDRRKKKLQELRLRDCFEWKFAFFPVRIKKHDCRWLEWYGEKWGSSEFYFGRYHYTYIRISREELKERIKRNRESNNRHRS